MKHRHTVDNINETRPDALKLSELIIKCVPETRTNGYPDQGPWKVERWETHGICVASDDFFHDVILSISGDFESDEQKMAYATWLAETLNKSNKSNKSK